MYVLVCPVMCDVQYVCMYVCGYGVSARLRVCSDGVMCKCAYSSAKIIRFNVSFLANKASSQKLSLDIS